MRRCLFFISVLLSMLSSCNTNEDIVSATVPDELYGKNSVSFTNKTSLTIGGNATSRSSDSSTRISSESVNDACEIIMEDMPSVPEDAYILDGNLDAEKDYSKETLYIVDGDVLNINCDIKKTARIIVMEGGKLIFNGKHIDGVELLCYGELSFSSDKVMISNSIVKTVNDIKINNLDISKNSIVYVGGNFECTELNASDITIHVIGSLNNMVNGTDGKYKDNLTFNNSIVCVEGKLETWNLQLLKNSNLHVDCKLQVNLEFNIKDSKLSAGYIDMQNTATYVDLSGSQIFLPSGGVGVFSNINLYQNVSIDVIGNGYALIDCDNFRINSNSGKEISDFYISPSCYLNYNQAYLRNEGKEKEYNLVAPGKVVNDNDLEITTDLINVENVSILPSEDACNPGFSTSGSESNTSDIVLEIPDNIEEEWFLKADDFAIRINGVYQDKIIVEDGVESLQGIKITEDNLKVTVSGIENISENTDYTYEVWLWISEETWASFTNEEKEDWISGDGNGTDITNICKISAPTGYKTGKNVYKGLSGHGDTPYIKISIHIKKETNK